MSYTTLYHYLLLVFSVRSIIMKTIIALSSAIALSLAANITVAQPGGWGSGQGQGNGDRAQMRQERMQKRVDRLMTKFDTNQDGQITLDEVQSVRAEHFGQMDADGNSLVSAEELESFKAKMREQYQNDATQNRRGRGQRGGKGGKCDGSGRGNRLQGLDNDGDGQISRNEFINNVPIFNRFDANNDGILTQEELSQKRGRGRR